MKSLLVYRSIVMVAALSFLATTTGCAGNMPATVEPVITQEETALPSPVTDVPTATPEKTLEATPDAGNSLVPVSGGDALYQDDFTDPASEWAEDKFDNYFIGYHEPEYYHVEVTSPHYKTTVFAPGRQNFDDFTLELKVVTSSTKTSPSGDFRYGVAFRRSGDQYYAFTISPRSKKWFVLKSTPSAVEILKEGMDEAIHDLDEDDTLRVDARGSGLSFHINNRLIDQVTDADYSSGEIGFYVETFDSTSAHIHFDDLMVRKYELPEAGEQSFLFQDDFTNPATSWPDKKFDNYFIGYHEPEYYHVEVTGSNYKTAVFSPGKQQFGDATIELQASTASQKTAATGDFRFGVAFRRSGDQYYAFTISPRTKKWYVLKSSPNALTVLKEGTDEGIHDLDANDILRVDAQGADFVFHINERLIGQVNDPDYATGEVGLYVESFDSANTHVHFDNLAVRNFEVSVICNVNALTMNVRNGPGTEFPSSQFIESGDTVEPVGRTGDGQWIKVKLAGSDEQGWLFNSSGFLACTPDVKLLPVVNP